MKLWEKGYGLDQEVESFMTGDDPELDQFLVGYDCLGSIAHAKMLERIGILNADEALQLQKELVSLIEMDEEGKFTIMPEDEDVHTAVEKALTLTLGDLGKKLHTARSRNDQILLDLRLFSKDRLLEIGEVILSLCMVLCDFANKHERVPMPGRTHFQRAMPSSVGLWAGAFAESLLDNMVILKSVFEIINQCPLGSAASYGVNLKIDRQYCADVLGFKSVQNNVLYANNSRGKFEGLILHALVQAMNDLAKMSTDLIIFCAPEFGYVTLPEKFCPGSSLMPQKRNPCPLELIRAKSAMLQGLLFQVLEIVRPLPSGYHRDFQETKRPLMQGFNTALSAVKVFTRIFSEIQVNADKCLEAFSPELFATDQVLNLVCQGMPFRDAYKKVGMSPETVPMMDPVENILSKTHQGATGNLGLEISSQKIQAMMNWIGEENSIWDKCKHHLRSKLT